MPRPSPGSTRADASAGSRAGTTTPWYAARESVAWDGDNAQNVSHPVGGKLPNGFGLYDMLGNVWEWTWDRYGPYPVAGVDPVTDPLGADDDAAAPVFRGGSWYHLNAPYVLRVADRGHVDDLAFRYGDVGFRIAKTKH